MLSFRKRLIKNGLDFLASHPFFLKFALLSILITAAFWFRIWAERGVRTLTLPSERELPSAPVIASPLLSNPTPPIVPREVSASSVEKVDLNSASAEMIEALPGVGPKLAREIVRYREEQGPFRKREDLLEIKGMGPKKLRQIEPYLTIGPNDKSR